MNEKTRQCIEEKIERILREFRFSSRSKEHPEECPNYTRQKPCHDIPAGELHCFFCVCPEYDNTSEEGGCCISKPEGKWFYHPSHPKGRIWDCSDCDHPHREENVRKYLGVLFGLINCEHKAYGAGIVKNPKNDADFQDF